MSVVRGNEVWVLAEVVASSESIYVGTLWVGGVQDGGRQNEDMLFAAVWPYTTFPPGTTPEEIYQLGIGGYLPLMIPVTQGNVIIKP